MEYQYDPTTDTNLNIKMECQYDPTTNTNSNIKWNVSVIPQLNVSYDPTTNTNLKYNNLMSVRIPPLTPILIYYNN